MVINMLGFLSKLRILITAISPPWRGGDKRGGLTIVLLTSINLLFAADDRLRLIHADQLENITKDGSSIQYLTGNVKFQKGNAIFTCKRSYYDEKIGLSTFVDSVEMKRESQTLTVDSLIYDSKMDEMTGYSNVHFTDSEYEFTSDTLHYYMEADSGIGSGNVHLNQNQQFITAEQITYKKVEETETVNYTAEGNVVIEEETRKATCGKSIYSAKNNYTILLKNPVVEQDDRVISGTEIYLSYADEILEKIEIPDRAHIVYPTQGKIGKEIILEDTTFTEYTLTEFIDDMTGRRMEAYFVDSELDSIRLEGMATTLYHLFDDSLFTGKNISSGDTITLLFEPDSLGKRDLTTIDIIGGARGEYHPDTTNADLSDPIFYRADTINYSITNQRTDLTNKVTIDHQDMSLASGFVKVTWEDNLLHALPDQSESDSISTEDYPTFFEKGRDPLVGKSLTYNFATRRGRVMHGRTKMQEGFYAGEQIRSRENDVLYVTKSSYTTCDLESDPHFHFEGNKMKILQNDKIIIKPLVLKLGGIPIFALPFGVIPDQSGRRHSGWIMPTYGENSTRGQYLEGLGYFWAINDFINSTFLMDFNDKSGIIFRWNNRYFKRYAFSGGFNFTYNRTIASNDIVDILAEPEEIRWSARWNHVQKMRHYQSLNVNASYYSDSQFNRKLGTELDTRLNQKAVSNATYSKRWPQINSSMSLNLSETRYLMADEKIDASSIYYEIPTSSGQKTTETTRNLPNVSFRKGQSQLFKGKKSGGTSFYWSYNSSLKNSTTGFYKSKGDTSFVWGNRQWTHNNSWIHNMSLSGVTKILGYISLRPSLSIKEGWVTKYFDADSANVDGSPIKHEVQEFRTRRTFSLSLSANSKLYGLFPLKIGPLQALRHTLTPSIGFTYQPDYSKPFFGYDWGYFKTLKDSTGEEYLFDPFSGTQLGSTSKQEQKSMSFSLKNLFQAKVHQGGKEKKLNNLLTWNMSTRYNFAAEDFQLSKLQSSVRTQLPGKLSLDMSMTHDFYKQQGNLTRINEIRYNKFGIPIPRLVNVNLSTSFRFSGDRISGGQIVDSELDTSIVDTITDSEFLSSYPTPQQSTGSTIPRGQLWNANVSLRYTKNLHDPQNPTSTFWMNTGMKINLTKNWGISYSARFDLLKTELTSHSFQIHRDLHCWELNLTWIPSGYTSGYYLKINVKAPTLKDLKVQDRGGRYRIPWS